MGEDLVPGSGGVGSQVQAFVVPAASQSARSNGAPTGVEVGTKIEDRATRPLHSLAQRFLLTFGSHRQEH